MISNVMIETSIFMMAVIPHAESNLVGTVKLFPMPYQSVLKVVIAETEFMSL